MNHLLQHRNMEPNPNLEKKLATLYAEYRKISSEAIQSDMGGKYYGVFLSVGNDAAKAMVFYGCGASAKEAWQDALEKMLTYHEQYPRKVQYIKLDIPYGIEKIALEEVNYQLERTKMSFWRKGLALDSLFQTAFLEQELNANKLILYDQNGISLQNINAYLLSQNKKQLFYLPDDVYTFQCISLFSDEKDKIYPLYENGLPYGRRKLACIDEYLVAELLAAAGERLADMVGADGKFVYGYRAIFHEAIPAYNILRHLTATLALLQEYDRSKSLFAFKAADRAVSFVLDSSVEFLEDKAFVVERYADEVKLGACALLVVVLEAYIRLANKKEHLPLAKQLGDGILFFADPKGGEFRHVLDFPKFTTKEKMRIPSYHSQGAYALALLYGLTGEDRYLEGAKSIADAMIYMDYTQYGDPWVAYAMNALTQYCLTEKYFVFAMKNVMVNLPRIYKQQTSYHIFLELLMASFEIYDRMEEEFSLLPMREGIDARWLVITIYYRAQHQLNGYMYPEYMMYFENPKPYLYSFAVRHDGFRMRVDDVGHFMSGYYFFWKNYRQLESYRIRLGITPADYMTFREKYLQEPHFSQFEKNENDLPQKKTVGGKSRGRE